MQPRLSDVSVDDATLQYEDDGGGEPLLFIHGAHVADSFLPVSRDPALRDVRRIRYHRRGYGAASRPSAAPDRYFRRAASDAVALLRHVGVDDAHVVGHSSGALVALDVARGAPEAVRSLILLEPTLLSVPSGPHLAEAVASTAETYHSGDPRAAVDRFMALVGGDEWHAEIDRVAPGGPVQAFADAATFFEHELPAVGAWTLDDAALGRAVPILCIRGGDSHPSAAEGVDLLKRRFPHASERVIEGAGHFMLTQKPGEVAEAIREFVRVQA